MNPEIYSGFFDGLVIPETPEYKKAGHGEGEYLRLLQRVWEEGTERSDRTGVGTKGIFGDQITIDLSRGEFPLLTTKDMSKRLKSIMVELLWFLKGRTDIQWLNDLGVHIWDEWADSEHTALFGRAAGNLGPVYGHQWRNFGGTLLPDGTYAQNGIDQITNVIEQIKLSPNSRRHIVSAWNPAEAGKVTLPPCHTLFQFYVDDGDSLSCQLYQRSGDVFLGVPFNIASYSLLTQMIAQITGLKPGKFVHTFGDVHIYRNHYEQVREQLSRTPYPLPKMLIDSSIKNIDDFKLEHFQLKDYKSHPAIKAPIAV